MNIDFRQLVTDLNSLIARLKERCTEAEVRAENLQKIIDEQHSRIAQLEAEKAEIDMRYHNLQLGMAATENKDEQINQLKEKYLAMVSEIDACIATLQHGQ